MMKLSELKKGTILYAIAKGHLQWHKEYKCLIGGKKTTIRLR